MNKGGIARWVAEITFLQAERKDEKDEKDEIVLDASSLKLARHGWALLQVVTVTWWWR